MDTIRDRVSSQSLPARNLSYNTNIDFKDNAGLMIVIGEVRLESIEIEHFLKKNIQLKQICQKILFQKIIDRAARERNITVTDEEIQVEADRQRREKKLEKAAETIAWLASEMISPEEWEAGIRDRLLAKKLSQALFSKEVDKFFAENKLYFEQILLYQIIVPYEKLAWEIFYQIEEEEMSFYQAAHLYDIDEKRRQNCGFEGKINRGSIKPDIATVIFNARPREIINPFQTEQGYHILMVEEFIAPQLTPEVSQDIFNKLFDEWLSSELNYLLHNATQKTYTNHNQ
jgi:parvulin-like peptidyl-prolyl isomerase